MDPAPRRSSFSLLRRWAIAFNVLVSGLLLLGIVGMVNYISSRRYIRFDWLAQDRPPLSPLTRQVLASLTNDVRVSVLFDPEESTLFGDVKALLTEYQLACRRLEVEFVNYTRSKGRADFLMGQYRISSTPDTLLVIFDGGGRTPLIVRERELSEYSMDEALRGQPVRRSGFKGEQFFTSRLLSLVDRRPVRALYLTGHGEPDLADEDSQEGYHGLAALLAERNILLEPFSLATNALPDDCPLLVVAGPRTSIPADELLKIDRYLHAGGRALILLKSPERADVRPSGLERTLTRWGVDIRDNLVIDRGQSQSGDTVLLTDQFGQHPVVDNLRGVRLALVMPRAVWPRAAGGRAGDAVRADALVLTSPQGVAVSKVRNGQGVVETNGVIPLAVAVEKGAIPGVSSDRGTTRLVVVGEAAFLGNSLLKEGVNRDFACFAVNWLRDRGQLQAIGPRPLREYQVNLTRMQMHAAVWFLLGVLPGSVLLLGLAVWLRRRK